MGRKVVPHDSKNDLPLERTFSLSAIAIAACYLLHEYFIYFLLVLLFLHMQHGLWELEFLVEVVYFIGRCIWHWGARPPKNDKHGNEIWICHRIWIHRKSKKRTLMIWNMHIWSRGTFIKLQIAKIYMQRKINYGWNLFFGVILVFNLKFSKLFMKSHLYVTRRNKMWLQKRF